MQGIYTQKYSNDDKKPAKILCLGFCILLDLIVLAGVIACFSTKNYFDLLIYLAIFAVAIFIRIVSLFLTYEIIIELNSGNISIIKKYATWENVLYKGKTADITVKKYDDCDENKAKKYVRLCPKSCENNVYVLELLERKYLICLDDYTYSLIEVKSDLS